MRGPPVQGLLVWGPVLGSPVRGPHSRCRVPCAGLPSAEFPSEGSPHAGSPGAASPGAGLPGAGLPGAGSLGQGSQFGDLSEVLVYEFFTENCHFIFLKISTLRKILQKLQNKVQQFLHICNFFGKIGTAHLVTQS